MASCCDMRQSTQAEFVTIGSNLISLHMHCFIRSTCKKENKAYRCVRMCVYVDMHVCVLCMYVMHVCMACMYACYAYMCVCMSVMSVMHEAFVTHVMYGMHDPNFVA